MDFLTVLVGAGLCSVALACFLEKFVPVVPSYALLAAVGITAEGASDLILLTIASVAGSAAGAAAWYGIGRSVGPARSEWLVRRFGRWVFLSPELYGRMADAYQRRRFAVSLVGQAVPTVRIYLPLPAGAVGIAFLPFMAATTLGALVWNAPFIALGHALDGTGHDPFWPLVGTVAGILALELSIIAAVRRRRCRP